jgi:preprotein translocase subunit SecA
VLNTQRSKIYSQRDRIFLKEDLDEDVTGMLQEEVMQRVPEALQDEGGPWKLLSWLEQIQPSFGMFDGIFPSYALRLLLDELYEGLSAAGNGPQTAINIQEAREALIKLAVDSLNAEKEHHLQIVTNLLEQSRVRMETQLDERLEMLDTFIEGLQLEDDTGTGNPQALAAELNNLVRLPIRLTNQQVHLLSTDPDEVSDVIQDQVGRLLMGLTIVRLIGAVERVLKEPLGFTSIDLQEKNWDDLSNQVLEGIDDIFTTRIERFIGNGTPGQLVSDLDAALAKSDSVNSKDLLGLIVALPQGRRASFDKKTHRRMWVRTNRLTYIYNTAHLLEDRDPEEIAEDVLTHLEEAQSAIRQDWGQSEFNRIADVSLADLEEEVRSGLQQALGEEVLASLGMRPLGALDEKYRAFVVNELGRQGLTKVYRQLLLSVISNLWVEYLTQVEALRVSIGLEAYAQRDPLVQYKNKAFEMFQDLLRDMRISVVTRMFTFQTRNQGTLQTRLNREDSPIPEVPQESAKAEPQEKKKKRRRRR